MNGNYSHIKLEEKLVDWTINIGFAAIQTNERGVMVFNATFNNISATSWQSVLLVEETRVPGENHQPAISHWQILPPNVVSSTPCHEQGLNSQL